MNSLKKDEIRLIKKGISFLESFIKTTENNGFTVEICSPNRDGFYYIFFDGQSIRDEFLLCFPIERINEFCSTLSFMHLVSGSMGDAMSSNGRLRKISSLKQSLNDIKICLENTIKKYSYCIFYSWQSDLGNSTNRSFIEDALEKAIKEINNELNLPLVLDKDTSGKTGSPDIVNSILRKIDESFIFVADISIVGKVNEKSAVNSNVIYETGYAQGVLSDENIILICNTAYGKIEDMPFDLRARRIMQYNCSNEISPEEKREQKDMLVQHLKNAIRTKCMQEFK